MLDMFTYFIEAEFETFDWKDWIYTLLLYVCVCVNIYNISC